MAMIEQRRALEALLEMPAGSNHGRLKFRPANLREWCRNRRSW